MMLKQQGLLKVAIFVSALGLSLFELYTAGTHLLAPMEQRIIYLTFVLVLIFLVYDIRGKENRRISIVDVLAITGSLLTLVYIYLNWEEAIWRATPTNIENIFGIILIILVLEGTRRTLGMALPIITCIFLLYPFVGQYLPAPFTIRQFSLPELISISYLYPEGIFGMPLGIMAAPVFLFISFGIFSQKVGGGQLIQDIAEGLFGGQRGGAAKIAVVSSCFFGTISGSGVGNVVVTGNYTIPMMKKMGFQSHVAGAIEAVASTGGTFMPPIMAAAAFLMASNLALPYIEIIKAAIIPALLYYFAAFIYVDLQAAQQGIKGLAKNERPDVLDALKRNWFALPGIVLMIYLVAIQYPTIKAPLYGIILMVVIYLLWQLIKLKKLPVKEVIVSGLEESARAAITVSAATACVGLIVGVLSMTGLAGNMANILLQYAGNSIPLLLILTMIACIIMGMGVTPTAVYILVSAMLAPVLIKEGINPISAHFFVFYLGCLGAITPPVALSCYAAAPIAKADPMKIGWTAVRMALPAFIMAFAFALEPGLVLQGTVSAIVINTAFAVIGVYALTVGLHGFLFRSLNLAKRTLLTIAGVGLILPFWNTSIAGLLISSVIIINEILITKRVPKMVLSE